MFAALHRSCVYGVGCFFVLFLFVGFFWFIVWEFLLFFFLRLDLILG